MVVKKRLLKVGLRAGVVQILDSGFRRNDEKDFSFTLEMTHKSYWSDGVGFLALLEMTSWVSGRNDCSGVM